MRISINPVLFSHGRGGLEGDRPSRFPNDCSMQKLALYLPFFCRQLANKKNTSYTEETVLYLIFGWHEPLWRPEMC